MEKLFISVLNMSLTASYVILFIILIRLPLKKAPKIISYALWSVVAFRLLCPFTFESIFSLLPTSITPIPQNIAYQQNPQIISGVTAIDMFVNSSLPSSAKAGANSLQIYTQAGAYIWIFGIAAMLVYSIISVLSLKKHLKRTQHAERNIYETDNLKTPFVFGIFKPRIYIPVGLSAEEKSYIIRHEQTHIRRYDHIIKLIAFFVLSIHWFNPLVWIAFILMSMDMEFSCDEQVIREMGGKIKKAYSLSLLSLASGRHILNGSPLAFGEGNVKGRIKNVLNYKKPEFWIVIVAVIAVACVSVGLLTNPKGTSVDENVFTQNGNAGASASPDALPEETSTENSSGAKIIDNVNADLKSSHSNIEITNEWISEDFGYTVLFGSLKSNPQQGVAVVIPTGDQSDKSEQRVLTPSKHGTIKADSLGAKASMLGVVAEDGYEWNFNVYNGFDTKN